MKKNIFKMSNVEVDQGWSWIVCVGSVIGMFIETGMVKALGVLLPVLREQFATKTWVIGFMISFVPGFGAVTCPLAGALSKRFSSRSTVMVFGCLAASGLIAGSLSSTILAIVVSFLLISFSIGAISIILGELATYFDKKYSIANSIAQMGLSLGIMIIPLLTQLFIDTYGWRGTMLLLGALNAHVVLSGAVMRPINTNDHKYQNLLTRTSHQSSRQQGTTNIGLSLLNKVVYYLDLKLLNDVNFFSMIWYSMADGYCLTGWLIYLVPYAIDIGVNLYKAAALATFGGIGILLGNSIYPVSIRNLSVLTLLYTSTLIMVIALALTPVCATYFGNYVGLSLSTAGFGCGRGIAILCRYQIIKELTDKESRTNAVMWSTVTHSFGSVASGFLSGWIYDQTGSFAVSFFILSGVSLLANVPQAILDTKVLKQDDYEYKLISSSVE